MSGHRLNCHARRASCRCSSIQRFTRILPRRPTGRRSPNVFLHNPSLHNFDPRFGLAYNPFANHKTSIRAGFGIFHDPITAQDYQTGFGVAPAWNIAQQIAPANIQLRMGSEYRYDSNVVLRFAGDASRSQRWSRLRPPGSTRVSPALVWTLIVWYSQTPSSGCPDSPNRCPCCP